MKNRASVRSRLRLCALLAGILAGLPTVHLFADCTLTNVGITPLPDLGFGIYKGFTGGLYPDGSNRRPPMHEAAGLNIAVNEVLPRSAAGNVDTNNGKIVLLSIGMSNTQEWASKGTGNFKRLADADPGKNPQLVIVDGAQGGQASTDWTNFNSSTWSTVQQRLTGASVTTNQVQVIWMKHARRGPLGSGFFPVHAQALQNDLEIILRAAKARYPNLKIAYLSCRTRCYTSVSNALNPEPFAFESGYSVKWIVEKQINGDLNYNPSNGAAVVPWLSWGPYLWTDGTRGRSDGFIWVCPDLEQSDFTHPSATGGVPKVGRQLLAFFKTDPTATPWFLRKTVMGQPPTVAPSADVTNGLMPLTVNFTANASDLDGSIVGHLWTFDDGTFSTGANPVKTFPAPGTYHSRLTVTDSGGNTATDTVMINVTTTLALWKQAKFTAAELAEPSISGSEADPDSDGISNELEYVLSLEPKAADPTTSRPRAAIINDHFTLTFTRFKAASDLSLTVEVSNNLETWRSGSGFVEQSVVGNNGPTETVIAHGTQPVRVSGQEFIRLKVAR